MSLLYRGTAPALLTPFNKDGEVDYEAYRKHVKFQMDNGVEALVVLGTTGEAVTLDDAERAKLIEETVNIADGKIPVIAGAGSNDTKDSINKSKLARKAGADALLSVTPYYNKPTDEGCYVHFSEITGAVDMPMIVYNVPGRTGKNMNAELLLRLAEIPQVIGVKESVGNVEQIMEVLRNRGEDFGVYSGDDDLTLGMIAYGGDGAISVVANEVPNEYSSMVQACLQGDFNKGRQLQYRLLPLMRVNFIESNPIPVKTALSLMGRMEEVFRLPLTPMKGTNKDILKKVLKSLNLIN